MSGNNTGPLTAASVLFVSTLRVDTECAAYTIVCASRCNSAPPLQRHWSAERVSTTFVLKDAAISRLVCIDLLNLGEWTAVVEDIMHVANPYVERKIFGERVSHHATLKICNYDRQLSQEQRNPQAQQHGE